MNLLGMTLAELKNLAIELGMPAFTGSQIAKWLYSQHVETIDGMTNISKSNREKLKNVASINLMPYEDAQYSVDGTIKYLFPTESGKCVETVYIPDGDRATLCVSSQVGCRMGCLFCQTGKQGFEGNLTAADILNQVFSLPERDKLTNIVFMGQCAEGNGDSYCSLWTGLESEKNYCQFSWCQRQIETLHRGK